MKLAYFSPLNPQPSGISDYSEELLPQLANGADITLFVDGFQPSNLSLLTQFECVDYHREPDIGERLDEYDAVVYHVGNDHRYHARIVETMRKHPGITVFHDLALQDFFLGLARERQDMHLYLDEMVACHGEKEQKLAEEHLRRGSVPPHVAAPLSFPLNCRLARNAEGIVTHSEWARARLQAITPSVPIRRINMPVVTGPPGCNRENNDGPVSIASFGLITPGKGIEQVLRVLATLRDEFDFHYTLVGADNSYFNVRALVADYGMTDRVTITGQVSLEDFKRWIAATDIALNIRERTVGETSASLCRIMAAGVPSIVADAGWYSEIPDDSVIKIPLDFHADALLQAFLRRLLGDSAFRARIGDNARRYMLAEHSMEQAASDYLEFIEEVIAHRPRRKLVASVSSEISILGHQASNDQLMRDVAVEVGLLAPAPAFKSSAISSDNGDAVRTVTESSTDEREASAASASSSSAAKVNGRLPKIEDVDYKRAAVEYLDRLNEERHHHLRTKPFYNLANKPAKYKGQGMDEDMQRHFCDFANMAVTLALPPGSRVLDVGCGSGWLSEYFARLGYEVKGIDISPSLIEMSRERVARVPYGVDHETPLRCTFAVHDIELMPLAEKFAAIVCYDSLHHFEDERSVIRHLAAMLPIGGQLFVLEGKRPPAGSASEQELRDVMREFRTLESPFDDDYLRTLLDENGFAVVGDYVSINGLFERQLLEGDRLPVGPAAFNYHYLICKKVSDTKPASTVPDSRRPNLLRADFGLLSPLKKLFAAGETLTIPLSIKNTGDTLWLAGQSSRTGIVMPAVRVTDDTGTLVNEFHGDPPLPQAVAPGETVNLAIEYTAPRRAGSYMLTVDLVDQHVCWFEQRGSEPLSLEFVVG
jgi:2-polyprenyl-3-methyl-5-hydroxy-6-metoxy-1,4-benzoquinol methylase/glycosyltransferase involved in cell wall biosynthesis